MQHASLVALILASGALLTPAATAQEVLPFPPVPSGSQAGVTIESSTYKNWPFAGFLTNWAS